MKKGIIYIDVEKCLACRSCEIACAVEHSESKDLKTALKEKKSLPRVKVDGDASISVPLQCRHCEDAPCVKICPTKALKKTDDSMVLLDEGKCIGCKWCIVVCPFGVMRIDSRKKVVLKCDLCVERLKKDQLPACVSACPTKALEFKTPGEAEAKKRKKYLAEVKGGKK